MGVTLPQSSELSADGFLLSGCRCCGNPKLEEVLSLGNLPLANALLRAEQLSDPEPRFPLDLVLCPDCSLLQITATVPPEMLFQDYPYFSSFSDTMLSHARQLAEHLTSSLGLTAESLVIEAASNDGYLLQFFKSIGIPVLGIEPATNISRVAEAKGIQTINKFFDNRLAAELRQQGKLADLFVANNVLAHVAHLHEFVEGVRLLLKPRGTAVFEAAYARETIDHCEFDQIYHEHLCYYSLTALARLFELHGLRVADAEMIDMHGGSLRTFVQAQDHASPSKRVSALLEAERAWGIRDRQAYADFAAQVAAKRESLLALLRDLKTAGKRIAGYGAPAKGAILLNTFGIGSDLIDYVVDRSTHKQGLYMPGCHLPIFAPERLLADHPDYALMLAWNVKDEILEQQQAYRQAGGRFIIPAPTVEII
ncbi:MAG: class I SAM-dependent methyltransferase [Chloroflexi bacterium]|nr:class I SAM-dependent methyltransferase [Chloroflexota bacterium]